MKTQNIKKIIALIGLFTLLIACTGFAVTSAHNALQDARQTTRSSTTPKYAKQDTQTPALKILTHKTDPDKIFNAAHAMLANGLEIIVIPNNRAPVITHMVWYKAGAADEPFGTSGIAHFLEHLMFKGSEVIDAPALPAGAFSKKIRALGGNDNAFTSQDYTAYFQSIAREHLETVMRMEAGRMRSMTLPPEEVLAERDVILEERRQRTGNNPAAKFSEQINAALFPNHAYGTPVIGWAHEMARLTREDAIAFYKKYYAPNNAILIVSGDVTADEVFHLAKDIYGGIEPSNTLEKREQTRTKNPPFNTKATYVYEDPSIRQTTIQSNIRAPSTNQNYKDSLALQVLADILGSGSTSRFYKSLVVNQKIATSAGFYYNAEAIDDGSITLYATLREGQTPDTVFNALNAELQNAVQNGVSESEVSEAVTRMQDAAVFARDSLSGPPMIVGRALTTGQTLEQLEYWARDIGEITAQDIKRVAQAYLSESAQDEVIRIRGILKPAPTPPKSSTPKASQTAKGGAQ